MGSKTASHGSEMVPVRVLRSVQVPSFAYTVFGDQKGTIAIVRLQFTNEN